MFSSPNWSIIFSTEFDMLLTNALKLDQSKLLSLFKSRNPFPNKTWLYPHKMNVFGVYWNRSVCPCGLLSPYVQNTSFCQSASEGINPLPDVKF